MVARTCLNVMFIRGKNYEIKGLFLFPKYTKPTFTYAIIPYTSNHPTQHKYATVKFLYNRLTNYDLQKEKYQHELNIIHNVLHNNSFPVKPQKPHIHTLVQEKTTQTPKHRWATFTYVGKETSYITNILIQTDLKIAFRTNNIIRNLLTRNKPPPTNFHYRECTNSTAQNAKNSYVGQTERSFNIRFNEHQQAFRKPHI